MVAAPILEPLLGVPGLALAWVGPYTIMSIVAAADLRRRVGPLGGSNTARMLVRVAIASAITVIVVVLIGLAFPSSTSDGVLVVRLIAQAGAGVLVYLLLARFMRDTRGALRHADGQEPGRAQVAIGRTQRSGFRRVSRKRVRSTTRRSR